MSIRPNKTETHRVRITVGGDKLSYYGPTATKCASLITTKILLDSVVSTILALFMCAEIHDFYCLFDLNEMFDLLHTFTTKKSMKMKNLPPSTHK